MSERADGDTLIRFRLRGLVLFSASLVLTGGALTFAVLQLSTGQRLNVAHAAQGAHRSGATEAPTATAPNPLPPWGELVVRELELERPEEYVGFEIEPKPTTWVFVGRSPEQVRELLAASGVDAQRVTRAVASELSMGDNGVVLTPDDELIVSLTPQARSALYRELAASTENRYMRDPFRSRAGDIERWFASTPLDPKLVALTKQLLYPRGNVLCFSDYELLMRRITADHERVLFAKTLSRQRALMVRLRIRPTSELEQLIGYWSVAGVHVKDLRPLLESLKRLPQGGSASIAFALPQFARQRLYTYPLPDTGTSNPSIDCHWSTLNFFNDVPDDRFSDPAYAVAYIRDHFYQVAKPSRYGDRIFLVDKNGNAMHSAVYIADDIVFTKNGYGFAQPWMLMHLKDLQDTYGYSEPLSLTVYRDKAN